MRDTSLDSAVLSVCGRYRYSLTRYTGGPGPALCWLMLNPSTADATKDDPTIRKVIGFTGRNGYGAAIVVNLFAWRATDPRRVAAMLRCGAGAAHQRRAFASGPENDEAIIEASTTADALVCAWGAQPFARGRGAIVVRMLREHPVSPPKLVCLGTSKDGSPRHPLMVPYAQPLVPFAPTGGRDG